MLQEKPGRSPLKDKLDELDQLDEAAVLDKAVAWEKLHARLGKKPQNRKIFWYWSAAACLVLFLSIQWFRTSNDSAVAINNHQPAAANAVKSKEKLIPGKDSVTTPLQTVAQKPLSNKNKKSHYRETELPEIVLDQDTIGIHQTPGDAQSLISESNFPRQEDTASIIVASPVKKKLRIVHINEINGALKGESVFARKISAPNPHMNIPDQDVSTGFTVSRNASDNILKIKISSSN